MISLILSLIVLLAGYLVYGRAVEKIFCPDDRQTPALAVHDGVDCVPLKTGRAFLIQLLNIAGTGPIFGALMGAVFGPVVFLWIVAGSILGGAVHDYMAGMISSRHGGASIAELSGTYLGKGAMWIMRAFSVILLVLCGTVFVTSPAGLLDRLTPGSSWRRLWIWTRRASKTGSSSLSPCCRRADCSPGSPPSTTTGSRSSGATSPGPTRPWP